MEEIFCKQVPIFFKASEREERKAFVLLQIGIQNNKHDSRKELVVKLTDEQDLYFLYTLRLAEEDFQSLKVQQGLLVDFLAFPQKFIDLIEMCIREDHKESPKFVLQFVSGGSSLLGGDAPCTMNVVETNPFKHLNHLSLRFVPGSDADVKTHLAHCLKQLKDANSLIQQKFDHTSKELSVKLRQTEESLALKSTELESLKLEWSSRLADITSKHKEEMALEKEKTVQFQSTLQVRFDKERRDLEQDNSKLTKQMETRIADLERSNKDLIDTKYKSEASIREYKSRLSTLEDEHARVKTELQSVRKDKASLDSIRYDQDKSNNHLNTRVAVLEQELRDKGELLDKSNDLLLSEQDKKKHLESEVEQRGKDVSKLEAKVKAMGDELKKGNEIIKKLQGEIKTYHAKVKLRTQIATEQEKLLGEKDQELEKLRQDLATTKDKLRETENKNEKLSSSLDTATEKLEESRKLLKTNENMIQWLNKQINEQKVTQNHVGTFELPSSTSRPQNMHHNFSSISGNSVIPGEDNRHKAILQRGVTGPGAPARQPQYQSMSQPHHVNGEARKSGIPVSQTSHNKTPPLAADERLNNSGGSGSHKDIPRNPVLDPKFLSRGDAIPVRGLLNQSSSTVSSSIQQSMSTPVTSTSTPHYQGSHVSSTARTNLGSAIAVPSVNGVRISQHMVVPKPQPPLASAYFPSQS